MYIFSNTQKHPITLLNIRECSLRLKRRFLSTTAVHTTPTHERWIAWSLVNTIFFCVIRTPHSIFEFESNKFCRRIHLYFIYNSLLYVWEGRRAAEESLCYTHGILPDKTSMKFNELQNLVKLLKILE